MTDICPRRFDLIAFDWDGTLYDSTRLIVRCIQAAVVDVGGAKPWMCAVKLLGHKRRVRDPPLGGPEPEEEPTQTVRVPAARAQPCRAVFK